MIAVVAMVVVAGIVVVIAVVVVMETRISLQHSCIHLQRFRIHAYIHCGPAFMHSLLHYYIHAYYLLVYA